MVQLISICRNYVKINVIGCWDYISSKSFWRLHLRNYWIWQKIFSDCTTLNSRINYHIIHRSDSFHSNGVRRIEQIRVVCELRYSDVAVICFVVIMITIVTITIIAVVVDGYFIFNFLCLHVFVRACMHFWNEFIHR